MSSIGSIQARGIEDVVRMFSLREVEAWSIWQGKQFLHKGMGEDDLRAFLEMLTKSASNPVYTLKIYEGIEDPAKIKNTTDCDGSFNFKILHQEDWQQSARSVGIITNAEVISKINALEEKILAKNDEDAEPESKGILGFVENMLDNPQIGPMIVGKILDVVFPNKNGPGTIPQQMPMLQPGTLGNVDADARINDAVQRLKKCDPQISEHLQKLAKIAEEQPAMFNFLIQSLDGM